MVHRVMTADQDPGQQPPRAFLLLCPFGITQHAGFLENMFTTNSPPQTHASVRRYPRPLSVAPVGGSKSEETLGFGDPNAPPFSLLSSASRARVPTLVELENCVRFLSCQSFPLHLTRSLVR